MEIKYLDKIKSPADVKKIPTQELDRLADEVRSVLIETVSNNGGHLSSNLGVVELTIAMHKVFDSPKDQFVFDVGHQAYTHKLLTGRYNRFSSIRTSGGLTGFTNPDESEHDIFFSGHSSTSVSSALGLAQAKLSSGDDGYVVAVIGDGSFTGGMVYEALNNAGKTKNKLIVILNDNKMSISENVGAFASYLAVIRTDPRYFRLKQRTEKVLNKIPFIGERISAKIFSLKTALKNKIYNKSTFFEDIGFRYMGPIDGHNIKQLCQALEGAKFINGPVVLHVITTKGKGYDFAEKMPSEFHGIAKFDIETGEPISGGDNFSSHFGDTLCEIAEHDDKICAVTAAMSIGTGLDKFSEKFPDRFFDVGIAEQHAVTFTSGLAKNGKVPIFAVYSTFLQRAYDQLIHDISLQRSHCIFAVDRAGFVGEDGVTHNGLFDVSFINAVPNFKIYAPSCFKELESDLKAAVYEDDMPIVIRYPRGNEAIIAEAPWYESESYNIYGDISNADKAIVTYGRISKNAVEAAECIENTAVIKLNIIKPINSEIATLLNDVSEVYFFEEGVKSGGVGEGLALSMLEHGFKGKYKLVAVDDAFVAQASVDEQIKKYGFDKDSMIKIINEV